MTDLALQWQEHVADAAVIGTDLFVDEGLETAVILSLFCDARAPDNQVLLDGSDDPRGWWADPFSQIDGERTGSLLWTLLREQRVPETAERARRYAEDSLAWMVDDGVASAIGVVASFARAMDLGTDPRYPNEYFLVLEVSIDKPDGGSESFRYAYNWQQQLAKRL